MNMKKYIVTACTAALAAVAWTRIATTTEWQDVPPDTKLSEIVTDADVITDSTNTLDAALNFNRERPNWVLVSQTGQDDGYSIRTTNSLGEADMFLDRYVQYPDLYPTDAAYGVNKSWGFYCGGGVSVVLGITNTDISVITEQMTTTYTGGSTIAQVYPGLGSFRLERGRRAIGRVVTNDLGYVSEAWRITDGTNTLRADLSFSTPISIEANPALSYGTPSHYQGNFWEYDLDGDDYYLYYDGSTAYFTQDPFNQIGGARYPLTINGRYLYYGSTWYFKVSGGNFRLATTNDIPTYAALTNAAGAVATNVYAAMPTTYAATNAVVALNQSVQYAVASGTEIAITPPSAVDGGVRDWVLYLNGTAETALDLSAFSGLLAADAAYTNAVASNVVTVLYFSEITNGVFHLSRQELTPVK